jgi:hypothetical protein
VPNPDAADPNTVILVGRVRSIDWRARGARFLHRVGPEVLDEVVAKLDALVVHPDV